MMKKIKKLLATNWMRVTAILLSAAILLCSLTVLASKYTDPQTYEETISSIDEKKSTVLGVSAAIAGSATLIAAIPDDSTTPLAEEMMDLSSYLALVVCILVLEKSLLTVLGAISCYILIPSACLLTIGAILWKSTSLRNWAIKILIFAIALIAIIPISMQLSDYIYEINEVSYEIEADKLTESIEPVEGAEVEEELPWYSKIWNTITETVQSLTDSAIEGAKRALNKAIDMVSVFVIAYCAIPILSVLVFLWLIKFLFGLNININYEALNPRKLRNKIKSRFTSREEDSDERPMLND